MTRRRLGLVLLLALAAGCGDAGPAPRAAAGNEAVASTAGACEPAPPTAPPRGIELELLVEENEAEVALRLIVRNSGDRTVRNYHGGQVADFWIENADGEVVWLWSHELREANEVFTEQLAAESFEPGQSKSQGAAWRRNTCADLSHDSAPPGTYTARALWMSSPRAGGGGDERSWWSPPVQLDIP